MHRRGTDERAPNSATTMNSRRVILPALVLCLGLAVPAEATTSTGGIGRPADQLDATGSGASTAAGGASPGGALADPMRSGPGGGAPAPPGVVDDAQSAAMPRAGAAQEPTPTTPQGGPQEPEPELPTDPGDEPTTDEGPAATDDEPGDDAGAQPGAESGGGSSSFGFLPQTGLGLAALAALGFALLLLGTALLRPTRARRPKALR
jgi:hypothetical protein